MKKIMKNNKKGFTLIELLAVIVILAILVMIAIPAVTKYLDSARKGAFADTASKIVSAVRGEYIRNPNETCYEMAGILPLLEKGLDKSPWGNEYGSVAVKIEDNTYSICMREKTKQGQKPYHLKKESSDSAFVQEKEISQDVVKIDNGTSECSCN